MGVYTTVTAIYGVEVPTEMYNDDYETLSPFGEYLTSKLNLTPEEIDDGDGPTEELVVILDEMFSRKLKYEWPGNHIYASSNELPFLVGPKEVGLGSDWDVHTLDEFTDLPPITEGEEEVMQGLLKELKGIVTDEPQWFISISTG